MFTLLGMSGTPTLEITTAHGALPRVCSLASACRLCLGHRQRRESAASHLDAWIATLAAHVCRVWWGHVKTGDVKTYTSIPVWRSGEDRFTRRRLRKIDEARRDRSSTYE